MMVYHFNTPFTIVYCTIYFDDEVDFHNFIWKKNLVDFCDASIVSIFDYVCCVSV